MLNKNHFVYIQVRKYNKEHGDNDTYVGHSHDWFKSLLVPYLDKKKIDQTLSKIRQVRKLTENWQYMKNEWKAL